MISQFLKTVSRSSVMCAGFAAALVCSLGAADASAKKAIFDGLGHRLNHVMEPTTEHQLPAEMTLAQYADDCDCGDVEDFDDGFDEEFDEGFAEGFEEDFDDDYAEDFEVENGDGYAENHSGGYTNSEGLTPQQRLNRVVNQSLMIMEKAADVEAQGSYGYMDPAQ